MWMRLPETFKRYESELRLGTKSAIMTDAYSVTKPQT